MFEARLTHGNVLKMVFEALNKFVDETNLNCNEDGIQLQSLDNSYVALVSLKLNKDAFEDYRIDKLISLGIKVGTLNRILKHANKDDTITLKADDQPKNITLLYENDELITSTFNLHLKSIGDDDIDIPQVQYTTVIRLSSTLFQIINEFDSFAEIITIHASNDGVRFSAKGKSFKGSFMLEKGKAANTKNVEIDITEEIRLDFALRYLKEFARASPLSSFVTLRLCDQHPNMQVEHQLQILCKLNIN